METPQHLIGNRDVEYGNRITAKPQAIGNLERLTKLTKVAEFKKMRRTFYTFMSSAAVLSGGV